MARPRTPTALHEIRGTGKKHPERMAERRDEPVPTAGIGPAKGLDPQQAEAWDEIVSLCPPGVLGNSDRIALEMTVRLLVQFRNDPDEFPASRMGHLISLLSRFGLTPADRSKISVPKGNGKNPFDAFRT